jgi:predicted enzyme related to lactoylglutathione lyase
MVAHKEKWDAGTPCWVDIMVSDLSRSQAFYRSLFGWEFTESQEEFGGYCNAHLGGDLVAGMGPTMEGMEEAPHVWTTYLATDDSAATKEAVLAAGGQVMVEPMAVGSFGTMAVYIDPTGSVVGTWESGEHTGFDIANQPGSVVWNDGMVTDFEAAKSFYSSVFGYTYQDMSSEGTEYAAMTLDGERPVGGIGQADEDTPPGWSVTFAVADTDAAVAVVTQNGGGVVTEPFDMEFGRLAIVTGSDGEAFGLMGPAKG